MHCMIDPFDPRHWPADTHEHRVYGDDLAQTYAIVDDVDYWWAVQWRWYINKVCLINRRKPYMKRRPSSWQNGVRICAVDIYLHVEIMKRTGVPPPTRLHTVVDHRDGNALNCRRANLRWLTPSQNGLNKFGKLAEDHHFDGCTV